MIIVFQYVKDCTIYFPYSPGAEVVVMYFPVHTTVFSLNKEHLEYGESYTLKPRKRKCWVTKLRYLKASQTQAWGN